MFGIELRSQRTARGLSLRALAGHVNYSYSYLAKIETGDRLPPADLAVALDAFFNTDHIFQALRSGSDETLSEGLVPTEIAGRLQFVPPSRRQLLQGVIGSTALAVLSAGRGSIAPTSFRGDRKPIEAFQAAHRTLIDEDNIFGPRYVIPKVQEQIASIEALLCRTEGRDAQELRYLQACYSEFCGWLYQDFGDHAAAQDWLNLSLSRAMLTDSDDLVAFILARQSQLAGDMGDARIAIDAAAAAVRRAPNKRLAAIGETYAAHGHALAGSVTETDRSYNRARELRDEFEGSSPWGVWLDDAYIAVHWARSMTHLGQFTAAIDEYQTAIEKLDQDFRRDRGVYLARQAIAHSGNRDADSAANSGLEALAIAIETRSGRIAIDLARVAQELRGQRTPATMEFQTAFRQTVSA